MNLSTPSCRRAVTFLLLFLTWGLAEQAFGALSALEKQRLLPLQTVPNARDLGGFIAEDGRQVKWGVLFRSGSLAGLNKHDRKVLDDAKIKSITDLRSDRERSQAPDVLPDNITKSRYKSLAINDPNLDLDAFIGNIASGEASYDDLAQYYSLQKYVTDPALRAEWGKWIRGLMMPGSLPQLFHGTEGKDRTGFAAAILLLTLGVPKDQVIADYAASNDYMAKQIKSKVAKIHHQSKHAADDKVLHAIFGVDSQNMADTIALMEREFGSVDAYLEKGLGISKTVRYRLQMLLLEKTNKTNVSSSTPMELK